MGLTNALTRLGLSEKCLNAMATCSVASATAAPLTGGHQGSSRPSQHASIQSQQRTHVENACTNWLSVCDLPAAAVVSRHGPVRALAHIDLRMSPLPAHLFHPVPVAAHEQLEGWVDALQLQACQVSLHPSPRMFRLPLSYVLSHQLPYVLSTWLQVLLQMPDLWQEAALLQQLAYKNKNQHRSSLHFSKLQEVGVPADVRHSQRRTNTPVQHCQHCRSAAVASSTMHHLL